MEFDWRHRVERYRIHAAIVLLVSILIAFDPDARNLVLGVWHWVQLVLALLSRTASLLGTTVGLFAKLWCAIPGTGCPQSITLEVAAHRVKHTAVASLDVFESFAHGMEASGADSVSYVDLWSMSDTVSELARSSNLLEASRLASSLVTLKDTVRDVEDGVRDINRVGWQAFTKINRWIGRVHEEIVRQHKAGVVDEHKLHTLLAQLGAASRKNIDDLITRIDKTLLSTDVGLEAASEFRRHALSVNDELRKSLDNRWRLRKAWEKGSCAVRTTEGHLNNVQSIRKATDDVQKQLKIVRGHLKDYQSNAGDFHSEINAMRVSLRFAPLITNRHFLILSLDQELRELQQLGNKIEKVLTAAKQPNRDAHDASKPQIRTK